MAQQYVPKIRSKGCGIRRAANLEGIFGRLCRALI
jgi:hypothetical protein